MDEAAESGYSRDRPAESEGAPRCVPGAPSGPAGTASDCGSTGNTCFEQKPSSGRERIDLYSGDGLRLCASDPSVSLRPCSFRFPPRYCAASGVPNARIADLSVIERDPLGRKVAVDVLEQPIEDLRRVQPFGNQPYDPSARHRAGQIDGQKPHERQSIARLILQRRVRQSIRTPQDENLEHYRPLHRVAPVHRLVFVAVNPLKRGPEQLPMEHRIQPLGRIAGRGELEDPLVQVRAAEFNEQAILEHKRLGRWRNCDKCSNYRRDRD